MQDIQRAHDEHAFALLSHRISVLPLTEFKDYPGFVVENRTLAL